MTVVKVCGRSRALLAEHWRVVEDQDRRGDVRDASKLERALGGGAQKPLVAVGKALAVEFEQHVLAIPINEGQENEGDGEDDGREGASNSAD